MNGFIVASWYLQDVGSLHFNSAECIIQVRLEEEKTPPSFSSSPSNSNKFVNKLSHDSTSFPLHSSFSLSHSFHLFAAEMNSCLTREQSAFNEASVWIETLLPPSAAAALRFFRTWLMIIYKQQKRKQKRNIRIFHFRFQWEWEQMNSNGFGSFVFCWCLASCESTRKCFCSARKFLFTATRECNTFVMLRRDGRRSCLLLKWFRLELGQRWVFAKSQLSESLTTRTFLWKIFFRALRCRLDVNEHFYRSRRFLE